MRETNIYNMISWLQGVVNVEVAKYKEPKQDECGFFLIVKNGAFYELQYDHLEYHYQRNSTLMIILRDALQVDSEDLQYFMEG